jgi:tetratricopeptide (TPR) repeat protein
MRWRGWLPQFACWMVVSLAFGPAISKAAELKAAQAALIGGRYEEAQNLAREEVNKDSSEEEWQLILIQSLLAVGKYEEARDSAEAALKALSRSVRICLVAREAFLQVGKSDRAQAMLEEINSLAGMRMWAYQDPPNLIALGRAAILLGADPRRVLELFFDRAKRGDPNLREVYLASGQLALDKGDFALAAKTYGQGLEKFPDDPDLNFGLAQAFEPSDRRRMVRALDAALFANTNHVGCYLLLVDHAIDGEEYQAARETLDKIKAINPWQPEAWAYSAVLAHLDNNMDGEREAREKGLHFWDSNPRVDFLIGQKLSQKYRFAESAAYQRQALAFERSFLPAKRQLAQDLLRLGKEEEGWQLAEEVHHADEYNVAAFNLVTLHETLSKFATLTNSSFIVRMGATEAPIYGQDVLQLLDRARQQLCAKYGLTLDFPVTVEIFPEQKDFGVRTFGMPDNPGFLGVCFGPVITANSPASQGATPANWQAVLWHEFCHVVTLTLTRNKMPRWLSEGISVYEELQADPTWGQSMTPAYREMILGDELTPVGDLSAAFLAPKSSQHLQFAYYESALVVEFLVARYGQESLKSILHDLGEGTGINEAIRQHCAPLDEIEKAFAEFARERAQALAPELDWKKPEPEEMRDPDLAWVLAHGKNYYWLMHQASDLLEQEKWEEAKKPLEESLRYYPGQTGTGNAYELLAYAHRQLQQTNDERRVLSQWAERENDAVDAFYRLMVLAEAAGDWKDVLLNARRYLAVNPLRAQPHEFLGKASEQLGQTDEAIAAYRVLLRLDAHDPADTHFRLARLLHARKDPEARMHVVRALEEAPRFRAAHRLFLDIVKSE